MENSSGVLTDLAFRFIPLTSGRELFVPRGPASATAGGLALYAPVTWKARVFHDVLEIASRVGLARLFMRDRSLQDSPSTAHLCENLIFDMLRARLQRPDVHFAVYQGPASILRKPTILAMDGEGKPVAFAKVGWTPLTRDLVDREYRTSTYLSQQGLRYGRLAPVLDFVETPHSRILISGPLRALKSRAEFELSPLCIALLKEVGELQAVRGKLRASRFWARIAERFSALKSEMPAVAIERFEQAFEVLQRGLGSEDLPWLFRFGDFVPWNFGIDSKANQVEIVDLEFSETESLVGWDILHFLNGVHGHLSALDVSEHVKSKAIKGYFEHFDIDTECAAHLQLAYLVDITLFYRNFWRGEQVPARSTVFFNARLNAIEGLVRQIAG